MTHFFGISRGSKQHQETFEKFIQTRMWPWKVKTPMKDAKTGKTKYVEKTLLAQGAYREIKLFEYVAPDECTDQVLTMFGWNNGHTGYFGKGWAKYCLPFLRKILGAKPIPKVAPVPTQYMYREGVGLECIGMKKDAISEVNWESKEDSKEKEKKLIPQGTIKEDL